MTTPSPLFTKEDLRAQYDTFLARGSFTDEERRTFLAGGDLPNVFVNQTSGSTGAPPLRIPRCWSETEWLGRRQFGFYVAHVGALPSRVVFMGGVLHAQAQQKVKHDAFTIKNFDHDDRRGLDAFDPDYLSVYPSLARELVADTSIRFGSLRAIKLGGEPVLPSDREKIFARFPGLVIIEQYGSTEMLAIAWRVITRTSDSGYIVSDERYELHVEDAPGWQPLVVRDTWPDRAFRVDGWFAMDDEARYEGGKLVEVRRQGDGAYAVREEADDLLRRGAIGVQFLPVEKTILCHATAPLPDTVATEDGTVWRVVRRRPHRLRNSFKVPLWLDTARIPASMLDDTRAAG